MYNRYMDNLDQFLPASYTAYRSKIGLGTAPQQFLSERGEVVLNWPYKDAVLEGRQTKEHTPQDEKFYHEILAAEEISCLFEPKVFTNWQRHNREGAQPAQRLQSNDNLVLRGNNLLILHSLKPRFAGKIRLIYIDVPFNTGNDSFCYNDRFTHSTWLTFVKNRLEVAKDLLTADGSIFVHADWHEVHYLKVLLDELFGRDNFINEIIWCYTGPGSPQLNHLNRKHDTILWYAKDSTNYLFNKDAVRVPYSSTHQSMRKSLSDSDGWTDADVSRMRERGRIPDDWWSDIAVAARIPVDGKKRTGYTTEKPVKLLERIIKMSSNPGDIVLDFFAGSGTTPYAAANLGRQFIAIEQLGGAYRLMTERLAGVASFVTCELCETAADFCRQVRRATSDELPELFNTLRTAKFLDYHVQPESLLLSEFQKLDLDSQKTLLQDLVDRNSYYINYGDMADPENHISANDQKLNQIFYVD